jgi:hypothetical protein
MCASVVVCGVQCNCAETDDYYSPTLRADFEAGAKGAGASLWIANYPNTIHGFASRPLGPDTEEAHKVLNFALETTARYLAYQA